MFDNSLLRDKKGQKYLTFDTETESLSLVLSRPWQIGYILAEGKQIISTHSHYILWKDLAVSKDAARITKFNETLYKEKAEEPRLVLAEFEQFLYHEDFRVIAHNVIGFDCFQHNNYRRALGLSTDYSWMEKVIDTNAIAKSIALGIKPDMTNFLVWQYKMASVRRKGLKTSLGYLAKQYGIEVNEDALHSGGYDANLNWLIFLKQIQSIEI